MANRLLPFRQYDENDVINLFANDASDANPTTNGNGSAGVFVSIKSGGGNFSKDPITYVDRTELSASYGHTKNQYPEVQLKVTAASAGATAGEVIGLTLKQTYAAVISPENAGKVSGVAHSSLFGGLATSVTGFAIVVQGGSTVKYSEGHAIGTWIGTGTRTSTGPTTDVAAGAYSVLKLNL